MSVSDAAKALSVMRITILSFLNEKVDLSTNTVICIVLRRLSASTPLLRMQNTYDIAQAPEATGPNPRHDVRSLPAAVKPANHNMRSWAVAAATAYATSPALRRGR